MLAMYLDADFFVSQTQQIMEAHMEKLLNGFELEKVHMMVTQFRCGGENFAFRNEADLFGTYPTRVELLCD